MENKIQEKIEILSKIDNDDSRFIVKVLTAFTRNQNEFNKKINITSIIIKNNENNINKIKKFEINKNIIDLDNIWTKPYFYTKMRIKLEELVNQVINSDNDEIRKNPSRFCKRVIYNKAEKKFEKSEDKIDIIDFIKKLNNKESKINMEYIFIAKKIDEETLFKEEYIKKALEIIKVKNIKEKYSLIYDEICNYLNKDFIQNNYCDFKKNKCVAQRKHKLYPPSRKNGCCFMEIRRCPNLKEGKCMVECVSCKLFSCKFLEKRGIGYWGSEIIFLQAFFNRKQRKHFVFDFYKSKEEILNKVYLIQDN